jgi:hypothetical protein
MIRITPEHIYVLRNSTGKPFTGLLDRLIRSSAALVGISPGAVLDNPRTNYPDGGVDTQVTTAATRSDPWGYFEQPSTWQYKAVQLTDLPENKLREEISGKSKGYVRSLLQQGYAYRMCIAHDESAKLKAEIKNLLDLEIQKVNPLAPKSIVLFASDIVDWVNKFPALAAEILGSPITEFFHFETWRNREQAVTKTFVPTPQSNVIFENIRNHLDWKKKVTNARLTVSGDAGVGKSRTVFEAIAALPEVSPLVLYTDDEDNALEVARALANEHSHYAVIVADECLDATAFQLAKILQGIEDRVRFVSIDNALEGTDKSDLRLNKLPTSTVEKIVAENFPDIDPNRRFRYCQVAQGYLRAAIFLCQNDNLIVEQGHFGELLGDTKSYLAKLFEPNGPFEKADFEALMVLSLVERCGVAGNLFPELERLCALVHLDDPKDVRERLYRMQKTNGLVGRAGRQLYVTPTPVAMACFQAAWSRWAEDDPKEFLEAFPQDHIQSFLARISRAPGEVGKVVNAYFRNWEISRGGEIFTNADETERLLLLVRANPDQMVPRLHKLVLNATAEQLGVTYGGGRRSLVVDAGEIAAFQQWFSFAEEILFTLALHESEPGIGNNATEMWCGLFTILSYVFSPFDERLKIIQERLRKADTATRVLCVKALDSALDQRRVHMIGGETYGNRIAPNPWRPKSWEEYDSHIKACLGMLTGLSSDQDEKVRKEATRSLIQSIRSLVFQGFGDPVKEGAGNLPRHVRPILRAELREFLLLNNSEHSPHNEVEKKQRSEFVEQWLAELASPETHDRLVEELGQDPWEHSIEETAWGDRIRELAAHLLRHEEEFDQELAWLSSEEAKSSAEFGMQLGALDESLKFLDRIVTVSRSTRNSNLARGYFTGVSQAANPKLPSDTARAIQERLNAALDRFWAEDPVLGFNVMLPSGDFVHSFNRAISAVNEGTIPAAFLRAFAAWNGPRHTSPKEARVAAQTLLAAAGREDRKAAETGLEFIVFLLMRTSDAEDRLEWLQRVFQDKSLNVIFGLLERAALNVRRQTSRFAEIFVRVLPADPDRATSILIQMMGSEEYEVLEIAAGLFSSVAALRPQQLMDGIGEIMLAKDRSLSFLFRKLPVVLLPEDVIIQWLEKYGLEGARILAGHVPGPFIGNQGPELHPVSRYILEKYGNDDVVYSAWVTGMHSGHAFAGSIADYTERQASSAKPFLSFPIEAVRRWARDRIAFAAENTERFRQREEELF